MTDYCAYSFCHHHRKHHGQLGCAKCPVNANDDDLGNRDGCHSFLEAASRPLEEYA
ncbi:MAG: hypothetical protein J4F28_02165 [Nitrosopumilaceae archaeon]|nr:hypothetical protein [Nitrosopumilaceae archaeon]